MKGALHILDRSGHTTKEWDTDQVGTQGPLDPAYAEQEFTRLVSEGWLGFGTTAEGKSEQIKTFDRDRTPKQFEKVTLSPQFVGG